MPVVYYVMSRGKGWCVQSRGFTWEFETRQEATDFAVTMAGDFAGASGREASVRLQDTGGTFVEVRSFAGIVQLPVEPPGPPIARRA